MISVSNLRKQYGKFTAVNSVTFSVEPGEIFGFLGVNGAGKTTTLRMLAGILAPTSGEISIGGYNLRESPELARAITGYIPDRPHVYARLTGREFLYFIAELYAVPQSQMDDRIDELLVNFGLLEWQHELIENYSHGMKQRIATCGGLIHSPRVLIVDEPMVGLDPHGAKLFKDELNGHISEKMSDNASSLIRSGNWVQRRLFPLKV